MKVNNKGLKEINPKISRTARFIILDCMVRLKHDPDDIVNSMSLGISFNDCKDVPKTRKSFNKAVEELRAVNFLLDYKPKRYIINPNYLSVLSDEQVRFLNKNKKAILAASEEYHNSLDNKT